jgi:GNAT superfamily N-acetyltransferase
MAQLRPLVAADAPAVFDLQVMTFDALDAQLGRPRSGPPPDPEPGRLRVRHLAGTDPDGAWLAVDDDGTPVGAALALLREGLWGLSLLVVHPAHQSEGIGSALLDRTLAYANGARGGLILGSEDARALRVYHRAGFALRPCLDAAGPIRRRPPASPAVREVRWPQDRELVDAAGRAVRGAGHAGEIPVLLAGGIEVLVHEAGGFAAHAGGRLRVLAAHDPAVATELLETVLARTTAEEAEVDFIDAGQPWAFDVVLEAGLRLRPGGATCVRGEVGPLRPYLPSGAYL